MSIKKNFEMDAYLARIGLAEKPAVTLNGLRELVRAQQRSIAFENLDPLLGKSVFLDPESLWQKMIVKKRGGYCFELNYLLAQAMEQLGFNYTSVLARVMMGKPEGGPKSHLLFLVRIGNEEFVTDAGFGGPGLIEPMAFKLDSVTEQDGARFKLVEQLVEPVSGEYILQRETPDGWFNIFTFNREKVLPVDVEVANYFTSTMTKSPFRNQLMCAFQINGGLVSFQKNNLVTMAPDMTIVNTMVIKNTDELKKTLAEKFKILLDSNIVEKIWERVKSQ